MPASLSARRANERPIVHVIAIVVFLAIAVAAGLAIGPAVGAASVQDDGATNESADEPGNDSTNDTNATELQPIDVANASGNDTEVIQLEGEGQTVTDPVSLEDGLLVAAYAHEGESNYQVSLWNEDADERAAFLVNEIGGVNGTTAAPVAAGNYSLEITADGPWNVTLVQPNTTAAIAAESANATGGTAGDANESNANESNADASDTNGTQPEANATNGTTVASTPATASGEGPTVLGPVAFEDSVTVTGNHSGESNFQVELWREDATSILDAAYVFNEIGQVEGAETRVEHTGRSWVVVTADGEWDLRFD